MTAFDRWLLRPRWKLDLHSRLTLYRFDSPMMIKFKNVEVNSVPFLNGSKIYIIHYVNFGTSLGAAVFVAVTVH